MIGPVEKYTPAIRHYVCNECQYCELVRPKANVEVVLRGECVHPDNPQTLWTVERKSVRTPPDCPILSQQNLLANF